MKQIDQMDRRWDEIQVPIIKLWKKKKSLDIKYTEIKLKCFSLKLTASL